MVKNGAELLVVPVNNAAYGFSAASDQHLQMSRMRAVEADRWVVNAGVSSITAAIDPTGGGRANPTVRDHISSHHCLRDRFTHAVRPMGRVDGLALVRAAGGNVGDVYPTSFGCQTIP